MYARVITIRAQPARLQELVHFFQECIVPAGEQQPGFEGLSLLMDEQAGRAISVAYWQTMSEMCAFDNDCLAQLADDFATFLDAPPDVELYEVRPLAEGGPAKPVLHFGETAVGVRIANPCDEKLTRPSKQRRTLQRK